jgi:hypothetical protein
MEIQGFPHYIVLEDGRIWSKRGKGRFMKPRTNKDGYLQGRFMKPRTNKDGYLQLCLTDKNGLRKTCFVHRLVALHYIPNPNKYETVDHIDRNILNNHMNNLSWESRKMKSRNRRMFKNNKSGFKYVFYNKRNNRWEFNDQARKVRKSSKNKTDMICYKYIHTLRVKAGHYG